MELLEYPQKILSNLNIIWTFLLLIVRYTGLLACLPGIGMGERGLAVRIPAIIVLAFASTGAGQYATFPNDWALMIIAAGSEFLLGFMMGMIPLLVVAGIEGAGHLSSINMGLGAAQLFDPTTNASVSSVERILGDLTVLIFLALGGHHIVIHAVAGLGGTIVPGTFGITENSISLLIDRSADIFRVCVLVAAPCVTALLLTQFVMGLITKAVPTVNVMIVSFPITICIGLAITLLSLPEIFNFAEHEISGIENAVIVVSHDTATKQ